MPGMLPFVGISVHALLALLTRWSSAIPRLGGFSKAQHKAACDELLRALVGGLVHEGQGFGVPIDLEANWQIPWPRPPVHGKTVVLDVGGDGIAKVREWLAVVVAQHPAPGNMWWSSQKLSKFVDRLESFDLVALLKACFAEKHLLDLFKQLIWLLGQRLQDHFLAALDDKASPIAVAYDSFEAALNCPLVMDRKLVEYVEASKSFCRQAGQRTYAVATDKASVGGLGSGLQTTIFVVGRTNTAILGIPQVASRSWHGPRFLGDLGQTTHKEAPAFGWQI